MAKCKLPTYTGEAQQTADRTNTIYKQDDGLFVYRNTQDCIHVLKAERECKDSYIIVDYLLTKKNTLQKSKRGIGKRIIELILGGKNMRQIYMNGEPTNLTNIFDAKPSIQLDELGRDYKNIINEWIERGATYYFIDGVKTTFELR